ncbi:MAG: MerR family transcriptional regulator [Myxococcales bacterium]|nr:MerR family transcriptional regulator [Myxococcales bacterium]
MTSPEQTAAEIFSSAELAQLEREHRAGISSVQVLSLFQQKGIKLSEATFRKYVQMGLLPTSRRVGEKGKHRGSRGLYPATVIRRIALIKRLMSSNMTLEQIRDSLLSVQIEIEQTESCLQRLLRQMQKRLERLDAEGSSDSGLQQDFESARENAAALLATLHHMGSRLAAVGAHPILSEEGGNP